MNIIRRIKKNYRGTGMICLLVSIVIAVNLLIGWHRKDDLIDRETIRLAATRSFNLLEQNAYQFTMKSKEHCASCHHTTLTSMVSETASLKGISGEDSLRAHRIKTMQNTIRFAWNDNHVNSFITAKFLGPYVLLGLAAEHDPASVYTDIAVDVLINQFRPNGQLQAESSRVPFETGEMHLAAISIRAIQLYASAAKKNTVDSLVRLCRRMFEKTNTADQQELSFQLLGLEWTGGSPEQKIRVTKQLTNLQRSDGGWAQLSTMKTDAYATGESLFALAASGLSPETDAYQKGLHYLLKNQDASGAWIVETRAYPIQPFFNAHFPPYDENQFISAAASNWATLALLYALPDKINAGASTGN